MATTIQIKRSANVTAPATTDLLEGELAYSYDKSNDGANAKLYIEVLDQFSSEVIHAIGGKYYTAAIDAATSASTNGAIVRRDSLGNLSANTITANNFIGNVVATSAAALTTPRLINLSGDLQGNVLFDGSQDVTIVANVINNSVTLGTDTVGDFVANLTSGAGIVLSGQQGENSNITVALGASGVTATTYGGTTNIPVIEVDTYGRITSASNATISTDLLIAGNQGTDTVSLATETLNISGGTGINTTVASNTVSIFNTGVTSVAVGYGLSTSSANADVVLNNTGVTKLTSGGHGISLDANDGNVIVTNNGVTEVTGTANEIQVSGTTGNVVIGLPDSVTITKDLTVGGNLLITGNVTTVNTNTLNIADPLIYLAGDNYSSDLVDIGFVGNYYDGSSQRHAGLFRDASDSGKFKLFANLQPEPTNVIDTGNASFSIATLVANLSGGAITGLTANIVVGDGGTGRGTLTTNAVLYGQGTSAVGLASGTAGQVLQIDGAGIPVFAGIDGGIY